MSTFSYSTPSNIPTQKLSTTPMNSSTASTVSNNPQQPRDVNWGFFYFWGFIEIRVCNSKGFLGDSFLDFFCEIFADISCGLLFLGTNFCGLVFLELGDVFLDYFFADFYFFRHFGCFSRGRFLELFLYNFCGHFLLTSVFGVIFVIFLRTFIFADIF